MFFLLYFGRVHDRRITTENICSAVCSSHIHFSLAQNISSSTIICPKYRYEHKYEPQYLNIALSLTRSFPLFIIEHLVEWFSLQSTNAYNHWSPARGTAAQTTPKFTFIIAHFCAGRLAAQNAIKRKIHYCRDIWYDCAFVSACVCVRVRVFWLHGPDPEYEIWFIAFNFNSHFRRHFHFNDHPRLNLMLFCVLLCVMYIKGGGAR